MSVRASELRVHLPERRRETAPPPRRRRPGETGRVAGQFAALSLRSERLLEAGGSAAWPDVAPARNSSTLPSALRVPMSPHQSSKQRDRQGSRPTGTPPAGRICSVPGLRKPEGQIGGAAVEIGGPVSVGGHGRRTGVAAPTCTHLQWSGELGLRCLASGREPGAGGSEAGGCISLHERCGWCGTGPRGSARRRRRSVWSAMSLTELQSGYLVPAVKSPGRRRVSGKDRLDSYK
jgi:hypothetical protein